MPELPNVIPALTGRNIRICMMRKNCFPIIFDEGKLFVSRREGILHAT